MPKGLDRSGVPAASRWVSEQPHVTCDQFQKLKIGTDATDFSWLYMRHDQIGTDTRLSKMGNGVLDLILRDPMSIARMA